MLGMKYNTKTYTFAEALEAVKRCWEVIYRKGVYLYGVKGSECERGLQLLKSGNIFAQENYSRLQPAIENFGDAPGFLIKTKGSLIAIKNSEEWNEYLNTIKEQ